MVQKFESFSIKNDINKILNIAYDQDILVVTKKQRYKDNNYAIDFCNYKNNKFKIEDRILEPERFLGMCKEIYDRFKHGGYLAEITHEYHTSFFDRLIGNIRHPETMDHFFVTWGKDDVDDLGRFSPGYAGNQNTWEASKTRDSSHITKPSKRGFTIPYFANCVLDLNIQL